MMPFNCQADRKTARKEAAIPITVLRSCLFILRYMRWTFQLQYHAELCLPFPRKTPSEGKAADANSVAPAAVSEKSKIGGLFTQTLKVTDVMGTL